MAKDKKENESMNDSDEFMVSVGEKIRAIRKLTGLNQEEFHKLVYPKSCTGSIFEPGTKTNRVSHWENGNQEKDVLTIKDIYAIAKVAGISPSELLNVDMPYKVQERSLADWFKTLFVDMPKSKCFKWVTWNTKFVGVGNGDGKQMHITVTLSLPMDIEVYDNEGHLVSQTENIECLHAYMCTNALKKLKECYPLPAKTIEENSIERINAMEKAIEEQDPFMPF